MPNVEGHGVEEGGGAVYIISTLNAINKRGLKMAFIFLHTIYLYGYTGNPLHGCMNTDTSCLLIACQETQMIKYYPTLSREMVVVFTQKKWSDDHIVRTQAGAEWSREIICHHFL